MSNTLIKRTASIADQSSESITIGNDLSGHSRFYYGSNRSDTGKNICEALDVVFIDDERRQNSNPLV